MNENIDKPTMKLPPLKRICMTIGQLPSSYVESMSYYEMLIWFIHYLRDEVIPVVNANGEAVEELQELYIQLQEYVNNYFDNLDVQEEINNKLDEMAESGQLTDIIAQYLGLAGMITFNNVTEMKAAENLVNGSKCTTLGYYSVNDGGTGLYKVRTITNEDVIDEGSIIALNDVSLVAELVSNEITAEQFGTKGDDTTDDYTALNKAVTYCHNANKILITNKDKTYKINTDLTINCGIKSYGKIDGNIIFGFMQDKDHYINQVTGTITLKGWSSKFNINKCQYLNVDGIDENYGFAWNEIKFDRINTITLDSKNKGFINENVFTGGNGGHLVLTTSSGTGGEINNNMFVNCDFSGGVSQDDTLMESNTLVNCYVEGESKVIQGNFNHISGTYSNIPNVGILNSSLLNSNAFARAGRDFISASPVNYATGGNWEMLKANGVPSCYASNPGTLSVEEDLTNPDGSDRAVKIIWPTGQTWMFFRINVNKLMTHGGTITLLLRGHELTSNMTLTNIDNQEYGIKGTKSSIGNDWFLYRWCIGNMSKKVKHITIYATTSTALSESKTTYFGGCCVSPYKTGFLPAIYRPSPIRASLSTAPTTGIWDVGDIVVDSTGSTAGWICTTAPATFTTIGS